MRRRSLLPVTGTALVALLVLTCGGLAAASDSAPDAGAAPAVVNLITGLVVNGTSTVTPLHESGTSAAVTVGGGGGDPIAAAFTPNGRRAYVVNAGADSVTPIAITDGLIASVAGPDIPVGGDPVDIAITPNGQTAFVVNNFAVHSGSHYRYYVTPITLSTDTPGTPIRVGTSPLEVAITPNGRYAYVTNTDAGTVTPILVAHRRALRAIKVQFAPEAIAITPNSEYVLVANNGSGTVTPIRVSTNKALSPIKVGSFPAAIAITPNGQDALVTNNGTDTVSEIRISDLKVIRTITVARHPSDIVITSNGKYAYTGSWNNQAINKHLHTVTVIKVGTGAVVAHISVGRGPVALGYAKLVNVVYVASYYANTVTPIDVATNTAGPAISLSGQHEPVFIAINPRP